METVVAAAGEWVSFSTVLEELWSYWRGGGFVMPPLIAATVVLWFALGWRFVTLRRGTSDGLRELVETVADGSHEGGGLVVRAARRGVALAEAPVEDLRPYLDDAFQEFRSEMGQFSRLVTGIVTAAPLAGLLGTVTGMIETFRSLGDMALFAQSGGVAGGISVALISTQMGLAVAIPGMLAGRILDRREERLDEELDELIDIIAAERGAIVGRDGRDDDDVQTGG